MKPYLVDVPVVLYVFIRPDSLQRVFDVIKEARPSTLILISDGPRDHVSTDKELIAKSREVVSDIDWNCVVHKLYYDKNQGMYPVFKQSDDFIFSKVDRAIFLEDDVVPSLSFFKFCADLLEKYKDDLRVQAICGMNHLGMYEDVKDDYFFSGRGSIWGYAIWKRTYDTFYDLSYGENEYVLNRLNQFAKKTKSYKKEINGYVEDKEFGGHIPGAEFYFAVNRFLHNQLYIVPKKNMIKNIGYGDGSTHANTDLRHLPKSIQNIFNMKTHEYEFPLKHPKFVFNDTIYENKVYKVMGWAFHLKISRTIERALRLILIRK